MSVSALGCTDAHTRFHKVVRRLVCALGFGLADEHDSVARGIFLAREPSIDTSLVLVATVLTGIAICVAVLVKSAVTDSNATSY
jgi:hypothetical protein